MSVTSTDLDLQAQEAYVAKTVARSGILSAFAENLHPLTPGRPTPIFTSGSSVAAFTAEGAEKPVGGSINRASMTPISIPEFHVYTKQAEGANYDVIVAAAVESFAREVGVKFDNAVFSGTIIPGFGSIENADSIAFDGIDSIYEALESVSNPEAIVISSAMRARIFAAQRTEQHKSLVFENGTLMWDGVRVHVSPVSGIVGAVFGQGSYAAGLTPTAVQKFTDTALKINGDMVSLPQTNQEALRTEAYAGSVVLDLNEIVLIASPEEDDEEDDEEGGSGTTE